MDVHLTFKDLPKLAGNRKVEKAGLTITIERPVLSKVSIRPSKCEALFFLDETDETICGRGIRSRIINK